MRVIWFLTIVEAISLISIPKKMKHARRNCKLKILIVVSKNDFTRINMQFEEKLRKVLNPQRLERIKNK